MGLYLCVFDEDEEVEGVEVGHYADFAAFRDAVTELLENGFTGDRFPTLILHHDSDGEWSPAECEALRRELTTIADRFRQLPPNPFRDGWPQQVAKLLALAPQTLHDSFIDIDGEPLIDRLIRLCDVAIARQSPILFQ